QAQPGSQLLYRFECRLRVDGHPLTLERHVGAQESFYQPYVINGMRVWFDAVADIFSFLREAHGECRPRKAARFAVCDAQDRICPEEVFSWYANPAGFIDLADTYNGDDCWLGAYQGVDAHGGLDVNMGPRTPNFAPVSIDDHSLFHSLYAGDNNNRWRGVRRWPNGDLWVLQNHHLTHLLIPPGRPVRGGACFQEAAGVHSGDHHHAHYVFKVRHPGDEQEVLLDPWILFWQAFEDQKRRAGAIRAETAPLSPARAGEAVHFSSKGSQPGPGRGDLVYTWTFGDGGWSDEANPHHVFASPGVYPVTLTVTDGADTAASTQLVTVDGEAVTAPALALAAPDEPSFRPRPARAADVYGIPPRLFPHLLSFTARPSRPVPTERRVLLCNLGGGVLAGARVCVRCAPGERWLRAERVGSGNAQAVRVGWMLPVSLPGGTRAWWRFGVPGR
ncbi:MAG: PKD domain-containing protein, partial [Armatimonadota bacterium]|nr:PKD domain-containing protein [Armatimonadota bacterium]